MSGRMERGVVPKTANPKNCRGIRRKLAANTRRTPGNMQEGDGKGVLPGDYGRVMSGDFGGWGWAGG